MKRGLWVLSMGIGAAVLLGTGVGAQDKATRHEAARDFDGAGAGALQRSVSTLIPSIETGGEDCLGAVDITAALPCDGDWRIDDPIGITTATGSLHPGAACWAFGDGTDNDRWYRWTNSGLAPVQFIVSTFNLRNAGPPMGDSQIAVYTDCVTPVSLACNDDIDLVGGNLLSDTCFFTVPGGSTIFIQFDGFLGNVDFDAGFFMCRTSNLGGLPLGDNCGSAIALGTLSPSINPIRSRGHYTCPGTASDYNEASDPTGAVILDQPETCFSFTASVDGWIQVAATPATNNSRIIVSSNGGTTWSVSKQCWSNATPVPPDDIYDSSAQHGFQVQAGSSYCLCVDSSVVPITFAGFNWDLELYYWPRTTQTNVDCGTATPIDFCASLPPSTTVTFRNQSTAAAGDTPGIPPGQSCSATFWDVCSGDGQDLDYSLTWTQRMVDCGCSGFAVVQTSPDLDPDGANVCDAALQIGRSCPITPATCVVTADLGAEGVSEGPQVTGLGAADVGTTFTIQADQYMASACPDFDLTIALLNCAPACNYCTTPLADLALTKTRTSSAIANPGQTVTFDVLVENTSTAPLANGVLGDTLDPCFTPLGAAGSPCPTGPGAPSVVCAGASCLGATCTLSNGGLGFVFAGFNLTATDGVAGGSDQILLTVAVVAGLTPGVCNNVAGTSDPTDGTITSGASVTISPNPITDLDLRKTLTSSPSAPPGSTVTFDIAVENLGSLALTNGVVGDTIPTCLDALGTAGNPCPTAGVPRVTCAGTGCTGATCTISNGGYGFVFSGFSLAGADGVAGGPDEITISTALVAGSTPGVCTNLAGTNDPTNGTITSSATVVITSSACQLVEVSLTPPIVHLPAPWVYTTVCSPTDSRIDNSVVVSAVTPGGSVDTTDGTAPGPAGQLILYQIDCNCANNIYVTENSGSGMVAVYTVP